MQRYLLIFTASLSLCTTQKYLSHWAQYRLTEMFETPNSELLSTHFSEEAWKDYQASLTNISASDQALSRHIESFVNPVKITKVDEHHFYAQSVFLVRFSTQHASWLQPVEMILSLNDNSGQVIIDHFEGIASKPMGVKNFAFERAQYCKNR